MAKEIAPFGNYDDPELEKAFEWFVSFIGKNEWDKRVARLEESLAEKLGVQTERTVLEDVTSISFPTDQMTWYLYLVYTALNSPIKYEPTQGARVLPVFKRLGADLSHLKEIEGVDSRVIKMMAGGNSHADSDLFELLVALIWKRNSWEVVEFLDESPPEKRPDIRARTGADEWFIECKRLKKSSTYSESERLKWLTMWSQLRPLLLENQISVVLDIIFHVELISLSDDFLVKELSGKLPLVKAPCKMISNDVWDVSVGSIDYERANTHLAKYSVKYPGDQITELVAGRRDPNRGFTSAIIGKFRDLGDGTGNCRFLEQLGYAVGAYWSCDAGAAIARKARDIRGRLSEAVSQLPDSKKGVVHVGLETLDGAAVEAERYRRIMRSVLQFDARGKDLQWVYCHLLQSYAPPDDCWIIDETVYHFGRSSNTGKEPISARTAVIPESAESDEIGFHWLRPAP